MVCGAYVRGRRSFRNDDEVTTQIWMEKEKRNENVNTHVTNDKKVGQ